MNVTAELACQYIENGIALIPIPIGLKSPKTQGWQLKDAAITAVEAASKLSNCNLGIGHLWSSRPTCAIDIDDYEKTKLWLAIRGIDIDVLLNADDAVQISSGRAGRAKLLYRLPEGITSLPTRKIAEAGMELRCANRDGTSTAQDVLPPSIHPDTRNSYQWAGKGDWKNIPTLPTAVLNLWNKPDIESKSPDSGHSQNGMINQGGRNDKLTALAGTMRRHGMLADAIDIGIQSLNTALCNPPLPANEVSQIARSVAGYQPHSTYGHAESLHEDVGHLTKVDLSVVHSSELPELSFILNPLMPRGEVTLLGGHGGIGKSMLALIWAAHAAAGRPWAEYVIDVPLKVVFLSLEDDRKIVLIRLRHIIELYYLPESMLENLRIYDCSGACAALMIESHGSTRALEATHLLKEAQDAAANADLVVIDNASEAFDGNENVRRQVRTFIRALQDIGKKNNAAVLLLAHIDKAAATRGSNANSYSGSTAWNNSARSRLALIEEDGNIQLRHEKSNHACRAESIRLTQGPKGILKPIAAMEHDLQQRERDGFDDNAVLEALMRAIKHHGNVTTSRTGGKTTWGVLNATRALPPHLASRSGKRAVEAALSRLELRDIIHRVYRKTPQRKNQECWEFCLA